MDSENKKNSKLKELLSSKYNKAILITVEVAILLTVVVLSVLVLKGDFSLKLNEPTKYVTTTLNTIEYKKPFITEAEKENKYSDEDENNVVSQGVTSGGNTAGLTQAQQSSGGSALADPSGWSRSKILETARNAVNKTKAYGGNVTVNHSESFTADVIECTGGEIVKSVANVMIGWVVKPVDEVLSFSGGKAVNSEGETLPLGLPIRNSFNLSESGLSSASIYRSGNEYIVKLKLVKESVGMYETPVHNASAIGYLDVGSLDLSLFTVDSADIVYKGSSVELHINADGYVTYAKYNIPLNVSGSAHRGNISGSAVFDGEQTEIWDFRW